MTEPATSADEQAVTALVHAYTDRVAAGDLDAIADLFEHGAVSGDAHPEPAVGRAAVLELYRATLAPGGGTGDGSADAPPHRLRVVTTDLDIRIDDAAGTATCASHFAAHPSDPASTDPPLFVGRYSDTFARIDGAWRFTSRHVHLDVTNADVVAREGVHVDL